MRLVRGFPGAAFAFAPVVKCKDEVFDSGNLSDTGFNEFELNSDFVDGFFDADKGKFTLQGDDPGIYRKFYFAEIDSPPSQFTSDGSSDPKVSGLLQFWPPVLKSVEYRVARQILDLHNSF